MARFIQELDIIKTLKKRNTRTQKRQSVGNLWKHCSRAHSGKMPKTKGALGINWSNISLQMERLRSVWRSKAKAYLSTRNKKGWSPNQSHFVPALVLIFSKPKVGTQNTSAFIDVMEQNIYNKDKRLLWL